MVDLGRTSLLNGNHVKRVLGQGGTVLGTMVAFCRTPAIVRMIAAAGFDLVLLDLEHSSFSPETIADMCEMARAAGLVPVVRPHLTCADLAHRLQDLGAMGLMFPGVSSRAQVEEFRRWMRFPPAGTRGHTDTNAGQDYVAVAAGTAKYLMDEAAMLVVQVESGDAVDRIDEILDGGGIDIVEIGRGNLSTDLGIPGELRHQRVLAAVDRVIAASARRGAAAGVSCGSVQDATDMMQRGVRCVNFSTDRRIMAQAYHDMAGTLRQVLRDPAQAG